MNQVIQQLLIAATYKDRTWIDMLSVVKFAINNAPLVQMDYGYHPTYVADIPQYYGPDVELMETFDHYLDRMEEDWEHVNKMFKRHSERIINKANEKRTTWSYEPGDMVLVDARNHHRTRAQKEAHPGHLDPKAI